MVTSPSPVSTPDHPFSEEVHPTATKLCCLSSWWHIYVKWSKSVCFYRLLMMGQVCTLTQCTCSTEGFLHSSFLSMGFMHFSCQTNRKAWLLCPPQSLGKQLWGKDSSKDFLGLSHVESVLCHCSEISPVWYLPVGLYRWDNK